MSVTFVFLAWVVRAASERLLEPEESKDVDLNPGQVVLVDPVVGTSSVDFPQRPLLHQHEYQQESHCSVFGAI